MGGVKKVKWLKGNHPVATFNSQGTEISATSSFTVSENGVYTVYAEDNAGNKTVQPIDVKKVNTPPKITSLTIPQQQFEHDDEHFIGWTVTDDDGDSITSKLQATYDKGKTWIDLYSGPDKSFKYKVPKDKTTVQFRVIASDGKAETTSAVSAEKTIREVTYHWNKFGTKEKTIWEEKRTNYNVHEVERDWNRSGYSHYRINEQGKFETYGQSGVLIGHFGGNFYENTIYSGQNDDIYANRTYVTGSKYMAENYVITKVNKGKEYSKGSFLQTLEAGLNAYQHGMRNSDGFWYERGQRVIEEDNTPPVIDLTEQENYSPTSTVTVKTHDIGRVVSVKWEKGIHNVDHFTSNGTPIGTGQDSNSTFIATQNGTYTVFAMDDKNNKTVQTIEVKKVNTAPVINSIQTGNKFNVLDDSNSFNINTTATDAEGHSLTSKATYSNNQIANGTGAGVTLQGSAYDKGFHTTPITVTVNDGFIDSAPSTLNNHIVIKVGNAADYTRLLNLHTADSNSYTEAQHRDFHSAYEAVIAYEQGRTQQQYEQATSLIQALGTTTPAIEEWNERLAIVFATVALEQAEDSLDRALHVNVLDLLSKLTLQSNKDLIQGRIDELTKFHAASDLLAPMEAEQLRHEANPSTLLDTAIVNLANFKTSKESIALTKDTNEAQYKTVLEKRLADLKTYYIDNKDGLTGEDLGELSPDVDPDYTGEYDEMKDPFKPISVNAEYLVKYTNALMKFLENVNLTTRDAYLATIASFPTDTGINFTQLAEVTKAIESIYDFRSTFKENDSALAQILADIQAISFGGPLTIGYMNEIQKAMKEVTEYNDIALDAEHDETERQEGLAQLPNLKDKGHFKTDMEDYLNNGIPSALIDSDKYQFIVKDDVVVKGMISDDNHTIHTVTASLGGEEISASSSSSGTFSITFNRPEGVYLDQPLTINVNDGLTNKAITITGKPVISVSNPTIFIEMIKLLENDTSIDLSKMTEVQLQELLDLFNIMITADKDTSPIIIRGLYNRTERLSTQTEGELETYVKKFVQSNYLEWLYENYLTATVDDFEFVGVLRDGKGLVTYQNIDALRTVITDYKNGTSGHITPTIEDYIKWVDMLTAFDALDKLIDDIYDLTNPQEVTDAIANAETEVSNTVPDWSSLRPLYEQKIQDIKDFKTALDAVVSVEENYGQTSHDTATVLVSRVKDDDARTALEDRLVKAQIVIDAIIALEEAERTKDTTDIQNAQDLIDLVEDGPKKDELQGRLDNILKYTDARDAVEKAEQDLTQKAHDDAKVLVDDLAEGILKDELLERLEEVQRILDATKAVEDAELSTHDLDITKAQNLIDKVITQPKKDELQDRLDNVLEYSEAIKAVVEAERELTQTTKDSAQIIVDVLPESDNKEKLKDRLDEVQRIIDAGKLVDEAEIKKDWDSVNEAQDAIDKVTNAEEKDKLQDRLDNVKDYIKAEEAVTEAEKDLTQDSKDKAEDLVNQLPEGPDKEDLKDRLDDLQDVLDNKSKEEKAEDAVDKVEETWDEKDLEDTKDKVDDLNDSTLKDDLLDRIEEVEKIVNKYKEVEGLVAQAEKSKLQLDSDKAQTGLYELATLVGKPDPKLDSLQERIDEVNKYIKAEKAVTQVEETKSERHFNIAQDLVNQLKDGVDKKTLQDRLDAIQDNIKNDQDILDKIINGNPDPTPPELADWTDEVVYEESMDDYLEDARDVFDQTNNLTKEDFIQIVRTVNALELAKRWMTTDYISKYAVELELVHPIIKSRYPDPEVMYATESYLEDDSAELELAKALAELLGRDVESVLEEMKGLLSGVEQEITQGTYVVQYVDVDTHAIVDSESIEAEFGDITYTPKAPAEKYELVNNVPIKFNLNKDTNGKFITIQVKQLTETTTGDTGGVEITTGSYTTNYKTVDGQTVHTDEFKDVPLGVIDVYATLPEGYKLVDGELDTKELTLTKENNITSINFLVEKEQILATPDTATLLISPVASLDINSFMRKNDKEIVDVSHQQYLYQASQGALMVTAYVNNPTDENLDAAYAFITDNLLAGQYKIELLKLLKASEDILGDYEIPELTPVYPSKPPTPIEPPTPPVKPEVTPPPTDNGNDGNWGGGGGHYKPDPKPTPPITIPDGGTVGTEEKVHDVVTDKDGSSEWTIDNPTSTEFTLNAKDVTIKIKFDKALIDATTKLEVKWESLGKGDYRLVAYADGVEIKSFEAEVTFTNSDKYLYLHEKVGKGTKAMPYSYRNGKFHFNSDTTTTFHFTKKKVKFNDIGKLPSHMIKSIEEMSGRLIINGVGNGKFDPNATATRAHFSAILARALGLEASEKPNKFVDLKGKWSAGEVQALYEAGLIKGTSENRFSPNTRISREQAVIILYRVLQDAENEGTLLIKGGKLPSVGEPDFKDAKSISKEAKPAAATLQELGLLTGQNGKLDPKASLTRAQLAKLIDGVLKLTGQM